MIIRNERQLVDCFDRLHDARVEEKDILFNAEKREFIMDLEFDILEQATLTLERRLLIARKYSHPTMMKRLILRNVLSCDKESRDDTLRVHTFNACSVSKDTGAWNLRFSEVLRIALRFQGHPEGTLDDTGRGPVRHFWRFSFPFPFVWEPR